MMLCRMSVIAFEIVEERKSSKVQVRLVFDPPEDIDTRAKITTHNSHSDFHVARHRIGSQNTINPTIQPPPRSPATAQTSSYLPGA